VRPLHWAHWDLCAALIKRLGCRVTLPTYPLLPEHQREGCYEHLEALCERLFERGEELIFCGDSAGAHLALSLCLRLKARGAQLPTKLVLFCPWVDVSVSHPHIDEVAERDPMLYPSLVREWGRWWAGELDPSDPTLNPLFADLKGLPPVSLFLAADDLLTPDAVTLAERLREAGVEVALNVTPNAFHDFMAVTWTPEARQVLELLSQQLSS
jgi:epsilon-lactone hydrolase